MCMQNFGFGYLLLFLLTGLSTTEQQVPEKTR